MNFNIFYTFVCLLLILVGVIIGQTFEQPEGLSKALEMISHAATTLGVLVAFLALNSWRTQFKYSKVDTLISELEDSFSELYRAIHEHRHAEIMMIKDELNPARNDNYQHLSEKSQHQQDKYLKYRHIYAHSFEKLSRYCPLDRKSVISPYTISRDVVPIFQGLRKIYANENFVVSLDLLEENDKAIELIWEQCKQEFERLRAKYC
ncbi:hypothetical protein CA267_003855 [Alteromonas pelagimontana]|uniref:DUF4760 domain-containing protein n=1 Tax=Alteromonas pelagimontana TaxID=1858656 RepID=A0A6M4MBR4_9ALTE|nr:hypothetical protein [Alteromonas pelagimontana]QJR79975.1 hypothetical protein CA267_003855 [Alteromonas pelagimontana]